MADLLLLVPKVISENGAAILHLKNAWIRGGVPTFTYQKLVARRKKNRLTGRFRAHNSNRDPACMALYNF
jgi:hypothetical protein